MVYFSRSSNTALAARHVARRLDAHLFALTAPDYALGLNGLGHALRDAHALEGAPQALPRISLATIDLTPFATV